ncbi:uncharacterized protein LOC119223492 [Pungitius pungitius]|uniref:uncharacterized protein LOC119223492 n=1 Tax=Pungitius pungitius TaxID=134920 RepID=UPI002E12ACFA
MRMLYLILLFTESLQLQCDKKHITQHVGGEINLICYYDHRFRYSKKYWCKGNSGNTCTILVDTNSKTDATHRSFIAEEGRGLLRVKVKDLTLDDGGVYWVAIDKMYADVMTSVNVVITEVPVSKPMLRPLSSLEDGSTCRGNPLTVRCGPTEGTGVDYAWYQRTQHNQFVLQYSSDLYLKCDMLREDGDYYCTASNGMSSQQSDVLSVKVLMPAERGCKYVVTLLGQPFYDCEDKTSTATAKPAPPTSRQVTMTVHSDTTKRSLPINQTDPHPFLSRAWTGVPCWYTLLRWGSFVSLLIVLCVIVKCTKGRRKRAKRKRRACTRVTAQLAN